MTQSKTIYLKLSEDEIEHLVCAIHQAELPKSKNTDGWNEESQKILDKLLQAKWEQR